MKRLTASFAALLFLSLSTSVLWAIPAQSKRTINPARIVQLSSSIRFLYKKVAQTNPKLSGRAKLEEVCTLLKHLGFEVPALKSIPSDVTKMELATSILTGQSPNRRVALAKAKKIRINKNMSNSKMARMTTLGPLPPLSSEDEDRVTNAGRTVNVLPVARLRFSTTNRRKKFARAKKVEKKEPVKKQLRSKIRKMIADRQTESMADKDKDKVQLLLEKLAKEAKRQLRVHRSGGMTVNKLVITTWKGLGLPCPNFDESWHKLSPHNLAKTIRRGLSKEQQAQIDGEVDMFIGS